MGSQKQTEYSLPRGVTVRNNKTKQTIVITFTYKGVLCREPLSRLTVDNKNIKYAERLLAEIQNNIERSTFSYAKYFPESKKLPLFGVNNKIKTIIDYLDEYLVICETRNLSPSTIGGYKKCKSALSDLHKLQVTSLTPAIVKNWIQKQSTSLKTIRNQLSFLRSAIDEAITDGAISINPVSLVSASRYQSKGGTTESSYIVDPLSPKEVSALLLAAKYEQWKNLFRFAINTGLRSSELCALKWSDIDFIERTAHVQSASVVGVIKETKTKAGTRKVELNDEAMKALNEQKQFTFMKDGVIFEDPKTERAWASADAIRKKAWVPTLKKAGVRYRNPYQTRHTFATRNISQGVNLFWLAGQMGHKGPEMLFRHYGSYLKEYDGNTTKQGKEINSK
ncbi:Arm DNA-binding domain-containing protein [Proteus mirabilis]|uniref:site-specific integrase n=1 Tax=Proteus terrae TaxID=1574161 RepID=UPI00131F669F|nr:site-specific integrase [Proteus terrae]ELI8994499.1 tyrosine-type recombinase/integrase [Proteus mirabilis]QHD93233.1 tyrosine-type recombinase/integrase [Proteus terrae subsp. cibarius]QJW51766.1 tyrosine-type recombinase/integrase [Proteus terrae subsp. cibarius]HEK3183514.1 tyrosine-type recombinase/integrase [Proteus mirabilis]